MSAMKRVRKPHLRGRNRHHLVLKIKFYWNTVIGWCLIFACLCATMAKVSSCNIDSTQSLQYFLSEPLGKKKSLLTPALKRQTSTGHSDGRTLRASQGRKARLWGGNRGTQSGCWEEGVGDAGVQRATWADTQRGAGQSGHLGQRSGLRRQHIPSLEIISRNVQTWVQILVCIKQLLKLLFSFVCPDGPESPERRC